MNHNFKVGDKVKVVANKMYQHCFNNGQELEVIRTYKSGVVCKGPFLKQRGRIVEQDLHPLDIKLIDTPK